MLFGPWGGGFLAAIPCLTTGHKLEARLSALTAYSLISMSPYPLLLCCMFGTEGSKLNQRVQLHYKNSHNRYILTHAEPLDLWVRVWGKCAEWTGNVSKGTDLTNVTTEIWMSRERLLAFNKVVWWPDSQQPMVSLCQLLFLPQVFIMWFEKKKKTSTREVLKCLVIFIV